MAAEVTSLPSPITELKAFLLYAVAKIAEIEEQEKKRGILRDITCPEFNKIICKANGQVKVVCRYCGQQHDFKD